MTIRVSSYGQSLSARASMASVQEEFFLRTRQAAMGGKISEYFRDIGTDTEKALVLDMAVSNVETYIRNIEMIETRIPPIEQVLNSLFDIAVRTQNNLIRAGSETPKAGEQCINQANLDILNVERLLNTTFQDVFLFGKGSKIPPVDISLLPVATPASSPDYSYNLGGNTPLGTQVDSGFTFQYGFSAQEVGFERLIRGLKLIQNASSSSDRVTFDAALGAIRSAMGEISNMFNTLGQNGAQVEAIKKAHTAALEYSREKYKDFGTIDAATIVRLSQEAFDQMRISSKINRMISTATSVE